MTPDGLAALHRAAFGNARPWTADEFKDLLLSPHVDLTYRDQGFALSRTVAGESELLTLAVAPAHQRVGLGRSLLRDWITNLPAATENAFLEVAADNAAALNLYVFEKFQEVGRRPAYYARKNRAAVDAILMRRTLTHRQAPDSTPKTPESG